MRNTIFLKDLSKTNKQNIYSIDKFVEQKI